MKKVVGVFILVSMVMFVVASAGYAAAFRIGVVDVSYLMNHHPKANSVRAKIKALLRKSQIEFDREVKAKKLNKEQQRKLFFKMKAELDKKENVMLKKLFDDINLAIRKIARKRHISVVFDKKAVIYGGYDITQDVLRLLKLKYASTKKK